MYASKNIGFKTCNGILNLSYWSAIYMGERVKLATSFSKFAWKRMIELKNDLHLKRKSVLYIRRFLN
ncbi:hypothetical protein TU56_23710 [Bacillus cereus]|nr:hypothetical protein FORC24_2313 [Bacillus cereus]KMP45581.1 hypothetical protein TU56_23710 [Bacillus cereus]